MARRRPTPATRPARRAAQSVRAPGRAARPAAPARARATAPPTAAPAAGAAVAPASPAGPPAASSAAAVPAAPSAARGLDAEAIDYLKAAYRERGLVLYTGAGVSMAAGLPSWWELLNELMKRHLTRGAGRPPTTTSVRLDYTAALTEFGAMQGFDQSAPVLGRMMKESFGADLLPT